MHPHLALQNPVVLHSAMGTSVLSDKHQRNHQIYGTSEIKRSDKNTLIKNALLNELFFLHLKKIRGEKEKKTQFVFLQASQENEIMQNVTREQKNNINFT